MKSNKLKFISLCIATTLLYGCGSDDDSSSTAEVQAYDGPVRGMVATYLCDNGSTGTSETTGDNGKTTLSGSFAEAPQDCSISFLGTSEAIDMDNGRDMSGVSYSAPKGLFTLGGSATVSPLTTLIDKKLNGAAYDESTASEVLSSLGLDEVANNGVSIQELLSNTEASVAKLKTENKTLFSKLSATKMILSDAISAQPDIDPTKLAAVTKKLSDTLVNKYPDFPVSGDKEIVVNLKDKLKDSDFVNKVESGDVSLEEIEDALEENIADATKPEPSNPDTPTGGTGGTGGTATGTGTGA